MNLTTAQQEFRMDLTQFCGTEDSRKWIRSPFSLGDYTYATNGSIMIRVAHDASIPVPEGTDVTKLAQRCVQIFKDFDSLEFRPRSSIVVPDDAEVTTDERCSACDGQGKEHDCPDCNCVCDECGGSGSVKHIEKISTEFLGAFFRLRYIRDILALTNCEFVTEPDFAEKQIPLRFRFDGGIGVVLPLNYKFKRHIEIAQNTASQTVSEVSA